MRRTLTRALALLLALGGTAGGAHITDQVAVGLYPAPRADGTPLRLLTSGTPVEVLADNDGFERVRLADGTQGWIEAGYVTERRPAAAELRETRARLRMMGLELATLREANAAAQAAADGSATDAAMRAELARLRAHSREAAEILASAHGLRLAEAPPPAEASPAPRGGGWVFGGIALVIGFVAGAAFVDYRTRRRHGGFRV